MAFDTPSHSEQGELVLDRLAQQCALVCEHQGLPPQQAHQHPQLVPQLVQVVTAGLGTAQQRLVVGEALGYLGDPRLVSPTDPGYWARVDHEDGALSFGRHMVTNREFAHWVATGGYSDASFWTPKGNAWREHTEGLWMARASGEGSRPFTVPNQPVVGVSWYEASAYAQAHSARLPRFDELLWAVRGPQKRPYPWGEPFGSGNANTGEESLGRPCAVGLYVRDCTPEGVCDLAGNAGEWCQDGLEDEAWVHPGSWEEPSMAAWAKARVLEPHASTSPSRGFRLVRVHPN